MRFLLGVALVLIGSSLAGATGTEIHPVVPFTPVFAADQKDISFNSLYQELGQFSMLEAWHSILGALEIKTIESKNLQIELNRQAELNRQGAGKGADYELAEYQYKASLLKINELKIQSEGARLQAEVTRLGILQEGDQSRDLRKDVAQLMKKQLDNKLLAQQAQVESQSLTALYLYERLKTARILNAKKIVRDEEMKTRQLNYLASRFQILTLNRQIQVTKMSIAAMERTLKRLFSTP